MTLRWGRKRARHLGILGSAALAAAVVLAAGCSQAAAPAKAATSAAHVLTLAEAQAVYSTYVAAAAAAAKQGDAARGLPLFGDAQWDIAHAEYTTLATTGTPVTQYSYGKPVFYVPALASYPLWFVVAVPARTHARGHLGPAVTTLMAFQRYTPSRTWTLDGSAVLDQPLPAIAHDSDGYAMAFSTSGSSLVLPTDLVGATQAAVVDEGPAAPAAAVIGNGPQTTGMYTVQNAAGRSESARGLQYLWLLQAASYAPYDLQTTDGGALVLYAMYLNTQTEHPGDLPGPPVPVPANFKPLLTSGLKAGRRGVVANWTYEFAAVDPPASAHGAKVTIIGGAGAPTYGRAY